MHLNYYLLKRLIPELSKTLSRATFIEAFSQEKDELILKFENITDQAFYIRATFTSTFTSLSFPQDFKRSRRNSANQFVSLEGKQVSGLQMFLNERAFAIHFDTVSLLFKMHGNRSNLILFEKGIVSELFKNNLIQDLNLQLDQLDRPIDRSLELFKDNPDYKHFYPTFGAVPGTHLKRLSFDQHSAEKQWSILQELVGQLENNPFYLIQFKGKPSLSLLPLGEVEELRATPIEAYNTFYRAYTRIYYFAREKQRIQSELTRRLTRTDNYIRKSEARLQTLTMEVQPEQLADILMANLHQIPTKVKTVRLHNFYTDEAIDIKLNPQLSPQKNAENYYRKSKNRKIEVEKTESNIFEKYEAIETLKRLQSNLQTIENFKELKLFVKANDLEQGTAQKQQESVPYKVFEFQKYQIWVGKNAKANDQLTLKHAYKEDLWLHAKDVPGSHVLIKHQSGKSFPRQVTERAAELAAYYSKRKTDSLVPVIFTPAKFVRKRKGAPAGQVVVMKEEVIMVPSRGPSDFS
ncbi:MAG: DUF814 domain-containing protein [Roseivirga sp.]|nr:DUF814 domain-containing protein [Roseivirga sp.]